jgi:hypothetical protein
MFTKLSEHFELRHFRPHYLDVDTIATTRSHSSQWSKKKVAVETFTLFTLQTFHYNYY